MAGAKRYQLVGTLLIRSNRGISHIPQFNGIFRGH